MNRQLVGQVEAASSRSNWVDVANHVGDGYIRRGQLLHVAIRAGQKCYGRFIPQLLQAGTAEAAERSKWVVVDFAPVHNGNFFIEQARQSSKNPRLGLPA